MDPLDIDPNFEPQTRARSNTWPLPRPDNFVEPDGDEKGPLGPNSHLQGALPGLDQAPKKNSSRRNAWGNMSYADLITQAIQSSPEKRLTLAQIYEWMVQNVAYFKDKGDSNSSAGWKNSIRHNLSLHNRFMRVQNEGTGKSSWWMINPDAKPGKAARRRATSMETQKYEKKRGRVKKKVEALRSSGGGGPTPSPSSSVSGEGQDLFPDSPVHHGFQLSPDFRPRASSNASSCGGRLSPIPAVDGDMGDSDMPPLSPIPWSPELVHLGGGYDQPASLNANAMDRFATDRLAKTLNESMKLRNGDPDGSFGQLPDCAVQKSLSNGRPSPQLGSNGGYGGLSSYNPHYGSNGGVSRGTAEYRPPPYQPQSSPDPLGVIAKRHSPPQQQVIETVNGRSYTLTRLQNISSHHHSMSPTTQQQLDGLSSYMSLPYMDGLEPLLRGNTPQQQQQQQQPPPQPPPPQQQQPPPPPPPPPMYKEVKEERLSPLLSSCPVTTTSQQQPAPSYHQHMMNQHQHQHSSSTSLINTASHVVGHLLYNALPQDLDLEPSVFTGGLECDVDQVIRHELSVEGNLDFNFVGENHHAAAAGGPMNGASNVQQHHQHPPITSTRSWVH